jgi:hypothetical protein
MKRNLLGFFLSGHPVDTLGGLGAFVDDITSDELRIWKVNDPFAYVVYYLKLNDDILKKMPSHGLVLLYGKRKDFSIPMFTEAFEQYGVTFGRWTNCCG